MKTHKTKDVKSELVDEILNNLNAPIDQQIELFAEILIDHLLNDNYEQRKNGKPTGNNLPEPF